MKRLSVLALAGTVALVGACADHAADPLEPSMSLLADAALTSVARVTTNADAGPGSFREAVAAANSNPAITTINIRAGVGPIALQDPIVYTGTQALAINGRDVELDGSALGPDEAAFVANGGGNLSIRQLTVRSAPGNGMTIAVPATAAGVFVVELGEVAILNNGGHGVLINDQAEYLTDPNSTSAAGSAAGVVVRVTNSRFEGNGFSALDRDGLRINEGGAGSLDFLVRDTRFVGNGADGLELDERGTGDAAFVVRETVFNGNGFFSSDDFDDGIDVDELGDGSIIAEFVDVMASDNAEQGIDLNENDAGDLRVTMRQVQGSRNGDEGIEFEEDDDFAGGGDIVADLRNVTTLENGSHDGDAGLKLREKGEGNLVARIVDAVSSDNVIAGLLVREDAGGDLSAEIVNPVTLGNGDDGIQFDENGAGLLDGLLKGGTSSNNAGAGVALEQATPGTGQVKIKDGFATADNTDGAITTNGVTVVQKP